MKCFFFFKSNSLLMFVFLCSVIRLFLPLINQDDKKKFTPLIFLAILFYWTSYSKEFFIICDRAWEKGPIQ